VILIVIGVEMAFGFRQGEQYIELLRKMDIDFERTDIVGLYELMDNYIEALKFVSQKQKLKLEMVRYDVDD